MFLNEATVQREFNNSLEVSDNYSKYVVTMEGNAEWRKLSRSQADFAAQVFIGGRQGKNVIFLRVFYICIYHILYAHHVRYWLIISTIMAHSRLSPYNVRHVGCTKKEGTSTGTFLKTL